MKSAQLLPLFRSEAQARILAWLLLKPDREQPISTLSEVAGIAHPNVLNEVNRLVESGILSERRAGRSRMVRADPQSPYFQPLIAILSRSYGPIVHVADAVEGLDGIRTVIVFGSWAERYSGIPGPPPRDVDILLVGTPDPRAVRSTNRSLEELLELPVQILTVGTGDWDDRQAGLLSTIASRPYVTIVDREGPT